MDNGAHDSPSLLDLISFSVRHSLQKIPNMIVERVESCDSKGKHVGSKTVWFPSPVRIPSALQMFEAQSFSGVCCVLSGGRHRRSWVELEEVFYLACRGLVKFSRCFKSGGA